MICNRCVIASMQPGVEVNEMSLSIQQRRVDVNDRLVDAVVQSSVDDVNDRSVDVNDHIYQNNE